MATILHKFGLENPVNIQIRRMLTRLATNERVGKLRIDILNRLLSWEETDNHLLTGLVVGIVISGCVCLLGFIIFPNWTTLILWEKVSVVSTITVFIVVIPAVICIRLGLVFILKPSESSAGGIVLIVFGTTLILLKAVSMTQNW